MGKLSTFITRLKQTLTKIGEDVKDLRDNKANERLSNVASNLSQSEKDVLLAKIGALGNSYIPDTPNLQQVTDIGSATTKTVEFGDGSGTLYRKSYSLGTYNSSNFVIRFPEITANTRSVIKINASQNVFNNSVRPQELLLNIKTGSFRVLSQSNYQNANVYYWTEGGHHYIYFQLLSTWHMVYAEVMSASNNTIIPELEPFSSEIPTNAVQADHCRLAMFEEIPSLTGYATESWVTSQGYLTSVSWSGVSGKPTSFPPSAHTHPISDITDLQGELDGKADIDGSNTTGGFWNIDELGSTAIGLYSTVYTLDSAAVNIQTNNVLGTSPGILLMKGGSPIAIAENENPDWDGYIYRAGTPKPGYPGNQQNGNYIIESKHRFRLHTISSPDSTSGTAGFLKIQPFNGIEHSYYRVTFTGLEIANIEMGLPNTDELTGFAIERNAIGQKCTVAVSGSMKEVKFTNVSGVDFSSAWNKGVFEFYWTGDDWMFGGYSPIEP